MKKIIFFFYAQILFSRNIAVLLGDFETKDGSYMSKISTMLRNRGFEVIDTLQVDTKKQTNEQSKIILKSLGTIYKLNLEDNVILVLNGQAVLTGVELFKSFESMKYFSFNAVNLVAIFTLVAPWQGSNILIKRKKITNEIINIIDNYERCKEYINEISRSINLSISTMNECIDTIKYIKNVMQNSLDCLGIEDVLPNSEFINSLNNFRRVIPIFNIISYCDKYEHNTDNINKYKQQISKLAEYAKKLSVINSILLMDKTLENNELTIDAAKQVIYASKLVNNLTNLLNELIEFNKEDNNGVLTVKEQQLPDKLNEAQCKLRNKEGTLGYVVKGVHRSLTDNHEGTVYDNDEVVDYISRSIDNNFNPVLKDEDVR